jgi:hypothetical protein
VVKATFLELRMKREKRLARLRAQRKRERAWQSTTL